MSKMDAMPLYLAIILVHANAYSQASVTLRMSGTVYAKAVVLYQPLLLHVWIGSIHFCVWENSENGFLFSLKPLEILWAVSFEWVDSQCQFTFMTVLLTHLLPATYVCMHSCHSSHIHLYITALTNNNHLDRYTHFTIGQTITLAICNTVLNWTCAVVYM